MELHNKVGFDNPGAFQAQPSMNPPPYFQAITQQPINNSQPFGVQQNPQSGINVQPDATFGLLNCLSRQSELYIRQSSSSCCSSPEMLQILDEIQNPILSVAIHSKTYRTGGGANSSGHAHTSTSYVMSDMNGQIVLSFVEEDGAHVTSGGLSLGIIHRAKCCSANISATTAVGIQKYSLCVGARGAFWPFCINSFDIDCNGGTIGKFEKISNGLVKIGFPMDMDMRSKALLLSLSLKGYLDLFAEICGCSSGSSGPKVIFCYAFMAIFISGIIGMVIVITITNRNFNAHFNMHKNP